MLNTFNAPPRVPTLRHAEKRNALNSESPSIARCSSWENSPEQSSLRPPSRKRSFSDTTPIIATSFGANDMKRRQSVAMFPQNCPSESSKCDISSFTYFGYHEITILHNPSGRSCDEISKTITNSSDDQKQFVEWDALTIRCADHDEMDLLVRALKKSSKGKVVPFSPNPKAGLWKKQLIESRKRARLMGRKIAGTKVRRTVMSLNDSTSSSNDGLGHGFRAHEKTEPPHTAPTPAAPILLSPSERVMNTKINYGAQKKENWTKADHCEICGMYFTLLTRRHHCRRCGKSCCGDCSSLLLVDGGDETRYCNRCSAIIIRKQSKELRRKVAGASERRKAQSITLPGKVHNQCHALGVGVMGKLPHWKNFLVIDPVLRPAVGRLTVELIEAIGLPAALNGKPDPYVRATITGYDWDWDWTMMEWLPSKRYSLSSSYCSSTLSPIWRGKGRKGGELLTLPIISTSGAILRLEILNYDIMANSRTKDLVLGTVEIPLSDLPNANLRRPETRHSFDPFGRKRNKLLYDGFVDRWYRILCAPSEDSDVSTRPMAVPIPNPREESKQTPNARNVSLESLGEIGQLLKQFCLTPFEWTVSALQIDLPRRPESVCESRKPWSAINVRIKLNTSEVGDLLSHTWFPPVRRIPPIPPFEPEILLRNVNRVQKRIEPYVEIFKFLENTIKWKHPPRTCVVNYIFFAFHLWFAQYLVFFLHFYILLFLSLQLRKVAGEKIEKMKELEAGKDEDQPSSDSPPWPGSFLDASVSSESESGDGILGLQNLDRGNNLSDRSIGIDEQVPKSGSNDHHNHDGETDENEETAQLNSTVRWIAKRLGENLGLDEMQHKVGQLAHDLKNVNDLWDGSDELKMQGTFVAVSFSLFLHTRLNVRLIWIVGSSVWYFVQSPYSTLLGRIILGFGKGMTNAVRRKHLHEIEVMKHAAKVR